MAALGRQLAALYDASGSSRTWRDSAAAGMQLQAACIALRACGAIAHRQPLPSRDALQLARGAKLVFCGGQAALAGHVARWRSLPSDQLRQSAREEVGNLAAQQLSALAMLPTMLAKAQGRPEGALAEFASQVAVPEAVLPWLATVSEALLLLPEQAMQPGWQQVCGGQHVLVLLFALIALCDTTTVLKRPYTIQGILRSLQSIKAYLCCPPVGDLPTMAVYCTTAYDLLRGSIPAFQPLSAALAASRSTQQSVAELLLRVGLPTLRAAFVDPAAGRGGSALFEPESMPNIAMGGLVGALGMPSLKPAVQRCLHQHGGAALVQLAADIMQALPVARPAGIGRDDFMRTHAGSIRLLSRLCRWIDTPLQLPAEASGRGGAQSTRGSTASDSSATGAGSSQTAADVQAAAWAVIHLLPHLAALLRELACSDAFSQYQLAEVCNAIAVALCLLQAFKGPGSLDQLAAWAAAADAGLRLLPLLVQLGARWRQRQPDPLLPAELHDSASVHFSTLLLDVWMRHVEKARQCASSHLHQLAAGSPAADETQLPPVARQLWQLHTTSCRLVHWLAAEGAAALELDSRGWVCTVLEMQAQFLQAYAALKVQLADTEVGSHQGPELARCASIASMS